MALPKVLFILKNRSENWGEYSGSYHSSGLLNSARFVCAMLADHGFQSKMVSVVDNNCIDREVTQYRPDVVIIEAYWVVPEKFKVLCRLHPKVKWVIRNHSETPFLANEGIAFEWTRRYVEFPNVFVSCNSQRAEKDFQNFIDPAKEIFLPNFYPIQKPSSGSVFREIFARRRPFAPKHPGVLRVACPGAIRPLKNHLIQAISAIGAAKRLGLKLSFHINAGRVENSGANVLKNLRGLFDGANYGELVEEQWRSHDAFLDYLKSVDVVMQCSLTETFNIVAANAVEVGVPIVTSPEVRWSPKWRQANPALSADITQKIIRSVQDPRPLEARLMLYQSVQKVPKTWTDSLSRIV